MEPTAFHPAVVTAARMISPTVRHVTLRLAGPPGAFTFRPGQWVDLMAPGVAELGGFSICSSPARLTADRCLALAVRRSAAAPSRWVHESCAPDDRVGLRAGGACALGPGDARRPLLLVAGGIGASPMVSLLLHRAEELKRSCGDGPAVLLLHSAHSPDELVFRDVVSAECSASGGRFEAAWFVTGDGPAATKAVEAEGKVEWRRGRIGADFLRRLAVERRMAEADWLAFLCGPPGMTRELSGALLAAGLSPESLRYEDWEATVDGSGSD